MKEIKSHVSLKFRKFFSIRKNQSMEEVTITRSTATKKITRAKQGISSLALSMGGDSKVHNYKFYIGTMEYVQQMSRCR